MEVIHMNRKEEQYDLVNLMDDLVRMLRLKATPVSIKLYKSKEELKGIKKLRRPKEGNYFSACQLMGQATRLNFTVGFTKDNLPSSQCQGVCGLCHREEFVSSTHLKGVWYETEEDALKHQEAMNYLDDVYEAVVVSPVSSGRIEKPDVCLVYGSPQQIMFIGCALQYENYEVITSTFVGETSCSDSWTKAIRTGKPCITIPCYGERRFGGVLDDEMIIAFPPYYIVKIINGLKKLSSNGMRYPASFYGIQRDIIEGVSVSYDVSSLK
jgi:uncharacterized protein (DUF169 family)